VFMDGGEIVEHAPARQFFEAPRSARARLFLSHIGGPASGWALPGADRPRW
jgi:ABC-type glutathione transport system ATPase component